jgi:malate dehydrogenase (oxaloacetate-decarboxylating)
MKGPRATYTPEEALNYHKNNLSGNGKIEVINKVPVRTFKDLTLAYTPGVAVPSKEIQANKEKSHELTNKDNMVAVVTDGTAVLGLGDIGPDAALPVMEGKSVLFKALAGVDAFPICIGSKEVDKVVETTKLISHSFGGINLEDIAAPACFDIESKLKQELDIPVFHDDQHGTAIVTLAGLLNALKVVGKKIEEIKVTVSGAGAAGIACAKFYMNAGVRDMILCDSKGAIYDGRENMNPYKQEIAKLTNKESVEGSLEDAIQSADVFLGLSVANLVSEDMVKSMQDNAIVFACANPNPEIMPEKAKAAGAKIIATGRSDYANQINNVLGFPGIFRGTLDTHAKDINEEMKIAASQALASCVEEPNEEYIITDPLNPDAMPIEAEAVAQAAMKSGVARRKINKGETADRTRTLVNLNKKKTEELYKPLRGF